MTLTLHYHPLSSFCHKVLIGLYELGIPFEKHLVDLGDATARAAFLRLWPAGQFPVLRDEARQRTVPESTIILEYIDRLAGRGALIPAEPELALEVRLQDRFYDHHIHVPMQKLVADRRRPPDRKDPLGVDEARHRISTAYDIAEQRLAGRTWAAGDSFTIADCAAAPALFYGRRVAPFGEQHRHLASYFARLSERPSYARVLEEAQPYMHMFPG